jgi:antitoxin CptB
MKHGELRWCCRRGMRELDVLLTRWLDRHYDSSDPADKAAFRQLLALPDPELARYLLAGERAEDPGLLRVIDRIRGGTDG